MRLIGVVGGSRMIIENVFDLPVEEIHMKWETAFEEYLK